MSNIKFQMLKYAVDTAVVGSVNGASDKNTTKPSSWKKKLSIGAGTVLVPALLYGGYKYLKKPGVNDVIKSKIESMNNSLGGIESTLSKFESFLRNK